MSVDVCEHRPTSHCDDEKPRRDASGISCFLSVRISVHLGMVKQTFKCNKVRVHLASQMLLLKTDVDLCLKPELYIVRLPSHKDSIWY